MEDSTKPRDLEEIISLASRWQERANELITAAEKADQKKLRQLILHPLDKAFLMKLIDQCFRSKNAARIADQLTYLINRSAFPDFFSIRDVLLMWLFLAIGRHFPKVSVPIVISKIRKDSGQTIIPGEIKALSAVLIRQQKKNYQMNLSRLGPGVLGREAAGRHLSILLEDLNHPQINYISIKVASICPQIQPIAFDTQLATLKRYLSETFRVAMAQRFTDISGRQSPKFINIDIEDCVDLELASHAFMQTLDLDEFQQYSAGIALQAYFPEALEIQELLTNWAIRRVDKGGKQIKLRIVKGANLELEKIRSSLFNWPLAPYGKKLDVDANFKRMIDFGLKKENIRAVRLGIASHNIFELAYAYHFAHQFKVADSIDLEMLFGVAGHIQRAIAEDSKNLVLYAPVARKKEFINAVGYLIRRLDENTSKDSFLRYANGLTPCSKEWEALKDLFIASCNQKETLNTKSHRTQNRQTESFEEKTGTYHLGKFDNEPFTDWSLSVNRKWAEKIREKWMHAEPNQAMVVPVVINGETIKEGRKQVSCFDPSLLPQRIAVGIICLGDKRDAEKALQTAKEDPDGWASLTQNERHRVLSDVARTIRLRRADLIGARVATAGSIFREVDMEVSKAVDYVEYYPYSVKPFIEQRNLYSQGKGVGVVITPKIDAIVSSCNGIAASLSSANRVILCPSPEGALPAWLLCQCFWDAGISRKTLQFLPGYETDVPYALALDANTNFVILDGHHTTAVRLLKDKPGISLCVHSRGKNSLIVTAVSDRDEAVKNIIESAFVGSGQKKSALSLLILEKEVYHDKQFKLNLIDAAASLKTGSAWAFEHGIGPLSKPAESDLLRSLTQLEPGESWALKPRVSPHNELLWTPGIKWGTRPGSFSHLTPFAGPVLCVMCATNFQHAIDLANQTGFGLVAGLECLDTRKQEFWKSMIKAGNLYINGHITNTNVLRQPFGAWGKSAVGRSLKSGGPNYITQFLDFEEAGSPAEVATQYDRRLLRLAKNWMRKTNRDEFKEFQEDIQKTARAMNSYLYHARYEFRMEKDFFHLRGQDNILRYVPVGNVLIRVHKDDSLFEILARLAAAQTAKCKAVVSVPENLDANIIRFLKKRERRAFLSRLKIIHQTDKELIQAMSSFDRIRYADPTRVPLAVYQAAADIGQFIAADPVLMEGRIEMLHYYRSQAICNNYHRYGNLGTRAFDQSMTSIRPPTKIR